MSATSALNIQLTFFILQMSFDNQNVKILIMGKVTIIFTNKPTCLIFFILNAFVIE